MKITLICGAFPPRIDGIGDYTWWLSRELAAMGHDVTVDTSLAQTYSPIDGVTVNGRFDPMTGKGSEGLAAELQRSPSDLVILQYNPFSFGRRGFCLWVPLMLRGLKKLTFPPKIFVMFHETTVPKWPWRYSIMYLWQLPLFRWVCQLADVALVSREHWVPQIRKVSSKVPVHHLPVGSNIALSTLDRVRARNRLGIAQDETVLGVFGSSHPSRMIDWIGEAARELALRIPDITLLYIGQDGTEIRRCCSGVRFRDLGPLPGDEIGECFRAMDCVIAPFIDGLSTKRGSAIASIQHGIPVASTKSSGTDRLFIEYRDSGLLLSEAKSKSDFAREFTEWFILQKGGAKDRGGGLEKFYENHFHWKNIASRIVQLLDSKAAGNK